MVACGQDSFNTLQSWIKELKTMGPSEIVLAVAGNKCGAQSNHYAKY